MPLVSSHKSQGFLFTDYSSISVFHALPVSVSVPLKEKEIELTDYEKEIVSSSDYSSYVSRLASGPVPFHSFDQRQSYFRKRRQVLSGEDCVTLNSDNVPAQRLGFKVRRYSSGEMTGGCFFSGSRSASSPPPVRSGVLESSTFTQRARIKIRRASECSPVDLKYFVTLTFSPRSLCVDWRNVKWGKTKPDGYTTPFLTDATGLPAPVLQPWHFNDNGSVRHDFAKYKIKKFLNTCSVFAFRRDSSAHDLALTFGPQLPVMRMQYVWVAELQENGNIHFHILTDKYFPIAKLSEWWNQSTNSVDVKRLDDSRHAINYMRKYMTKDENSLIQGNRYFITKGLHDAMKPEEEIITSSIPDDVNQVPWGEGASVREMLQAMKTEITRHGGTVLDFGFSCPAPRRSRLFKDKKTGEKKWSSGVSRQLSSFVLSAISLSLPSVYPF